MGTIAGSLGVTEISQTELETKEQPSSPLLKASAGENVSSDYLLTMASINSLLGV